MDDDRINVASAKESSHGDNQSYYTERERATMRETVTYIADVKEAFLDEPAKFDDFFKLIMKDVCDLKIDKALGSARMAEIIRGHTRLLLGLRVLFPKSKQHTESDDTKNKSAADAEYYYMNKFKKTPLIGGRSVSPTLTMDDDHLNVASAKEASHDDNHSYYTERERATMSETVTYIADVKEAFLDEPAKFDEFFKLMKDVCDHKIDEALGSARMAEIIKGHMTLLLGLRVLFPKSKQHAESDDTKNTSAADAEYSMNKVKKDSYAFRDAMKMIEKGKKPVKKEHKEADRTIRSEASRTIPPKAKLTTHSKASRTIPHEASRNIPPKADNTIPSEASRNIPPEVKKTILSKTRNRIIPPEAKKTILPKVKTTFLPEDKLSFFIPKAKRTIPPEAELTGGAESNNNKKKRAANFIENLKARFHGDDRHVCDTFLQILKMYKEGNKSEDEVYQEVIALLQDHEDLVMEFLQWKTVSALV